LSLDGLNRKGRGQIRDPLGALIDDYDTDTSSNVFGRERASPVQSPTAHALTSLRSR